MRRFLAILILSASIIIPVASSDAQAQKAAKTWEEEYLSDPRWAKHYADNPEAAAYSKARWEEDQAIKAKGVIDNIYDCRRFGRDWDSSTQKCLSFEESGVVLSNRRNSYVSKNYSIKQNTVPLPDKAKTRTTSRPVNTSASSPSRSVAQSSDTIHEKCKEARDYQGCVDSFKGRRSSSNSSDYERRMLEIEMEKLRALEQQLDRARRHEREQEEREYARAERQRKRELMDVFQKGINDLGDAFKGPDILHCDTSNYGFGSSTTCY